MIDHEAQLFRFVHSDDIYFDTTRVAAEVSTGMLRDLTLNYQILTGNISVLAGDFENIS